MKIIQIKMILITALVLNCLNSKSQEVDSSFAFKANVPRKLFDGVEEESEKMQAKVLKRTNGYLQQLAREERTIRRKVLRVDSAFANAVFQDPSPFYDALAKKMLSAGDVSVYLSRLDSLNTAAKFLIQGSPLQSLDQMNSKLKMVIASLDNAKASFNRAEAIKGMVEDRRRFLTEKLSQLGLVKLLDKYNRQLYYYRQQIQEYKNIIEDPKQIGAYAMEWVNRMPEFQKFFTQHSEFASLFRQPSATSLDVAILSGLQTRNQLQSNLQQRLGVNAMNLATLQQNLQTGQEQLRQLKEKLQKFGGSQAELDMPEFRPNSQKTKSFLSRLEIGTDLQTTRSSQFYPVTTDIGLSLGYRLNDKNVFGIGSSFKMGWGEGWDHVKITAEGASLRSFWDWRVKGGWWLTAGAEFNYYHRIESLEVFKFYSNWQRSSLLGIQKKYKVGKKLQGKIQLLYDFLYQTHVPHSQPLLFRIGYSY